MAYIPCLAHNIQLVVQDGLKLSESYTKLINRVSHDIVSKSKFSHVIAEELRKINKKLNKKNLTRWNSVLFMIRSVLRLKPEELKLISDQMPNKTETQRQAKKNFNLTNIEREMLEELKDLLELFEFVTDELQSNRINISRVYPCFQFLRKNLDRTNENENRLSKIKYTCQIRSDLLKSLNDRFENLMDDDVFVAATFLDPLFGIDSFNNDKKLVVKARMISLLKEQETLTRVLQNIQLKSPEKVNNSKKSSIEINRNNNYVFHREKSTTTTNKIDKSLEDEVNDYIRIITDNDLEIKCSLLFWKTNEARLSL